MREKILLGGDTNTGKTMNIIQLAVLFPDKQVWAFDAEGDIMLTLEEMGLELPNLTVKNVKPDWSEFTTNYKEAKRVLTPNDWMCFDMMGVFWDLAQNSFSRSVFGESPSEHIVKLRSEAKKAEFGGFDGLTDWTVIKRMHNEDIFDDAIRWSDFNVMATTSLTDFAAREKLPTTGVEGLMANEFGKKLEGEKHNKFRFRTIAVIYRRNRDNKFLFKLVKMKNAVLQSPLPEYDFTGKSFFEVYAGIRGIEL
jgi:hypothetical protein